MKFFCALLLLVITINCSRKEDYLPDSTLLKAEQDTLRVWIESYYDVMSQRDWNQYQEYFWKGATLTTIWQPDGEEQPGVIVTTIHDFIAKTSEGPDSQPIFEEKMTALPEIEIVNRIAIVKAKYHVKFGKANALQEWDGLDVFVLMKYEGEWRIVSLTYE